jgi:SAM-dependent methyltransferase
MIKTIAQCRLCRLDSSELIRVLSVGEQHYSGIFPSKRSQRVGIGPLELLRCPRCDLTQLAHKYNQDEFFGSDYGYMSGATKYMRDHLYGITSYGEELVKLKPGDNVLDIGSNDGTLLNLYSVEGLKKFGVDPSAEKFRDSYPSGAEIIVAPFSLELFHKLDAKKFVVVTSISMFYDLDDPKRFAMDIASILDDSGVWIFEQSYLPMMLRQNSYDTICHEHIEYYSIQAIDYITRSAGLKIIDLSINDLNGGSIRVTASKDKCQKYKVKPEVEFFLLDERSRYDEITTNFSVVDDFVKSHGDRLRSLLYKIRKAGKLVLGYGASTKGNVIIQNCGLTEDDLPFIGDITPFKDGRLTPGSGIPIISMERAKAMNPDYFLVFPWSFKQDILRREDLLLREGVKFIFPLPEIEVYG